MQLKQFLLTSLFSLSLLASCHIRAQTPGPGAPAAMPLPPGVEQTLKAKIQGVTEVRTTPLPGIYEIRFEGSGIFYSDAGGDYLLKGELFEVATERNLTQERTKRLVAIDFHSFPFSNAFAIEKGNAQREFALFSDPDCKPCRAFERELMKLDNIKIQVFLYPILSKRSEILAKNIWCSGNKVKAWLDLTFKDIEPPTASCTSDVSVDANKAYGLKIGAKMAPALYFPDGSGITGAFEAPQVEKKLFGVYGR